MQRATATRRGAITLLAGMVLLTACSQRSVALTDPPIATPTRKATPVRLVPTATVAPTPTAVPPAAALEQLGRDIDARAAVADRQNAALEARLNAGTTLAPLATTLQDAIEANQRAAAAVSALSLPPSIAAYRAVRRYRAAVAAGYSAQADAWEALARAAKSSGAVPDSYQLLAGQATAQFHAATTAHASALIAFGAAPEGSAPD